jgi:hypothetical protein
MLRFCMELEAQLTPAEKRDREEPMAELRSCIERAAKSGGFRADPGVYKKSFGKKGSADIRVDLDVFLGSACVADPKPLPQ